MLRLGTSDRTNLLRHVPLFHELNDRELARIAQSSEQITYEPGTVLMRQGQPGRELLIVVNGSLRVERDGRVIAHLGNGDFVGEMSLLDGQPRSATVVTECEIACLRITGGAFDDLLERVPGLARNMLFVLSRRIRDLEERFVVPLAGREPGTGRGDGAPTGHRVGVPVVDGVLCKRNHFNSPDAAYCSICGISMLQASRQPVRAPRPALGVLVVDNGSLHVLDGDYVVGATPAEDPRVQANEARPLALNGRGVARHHCDVLLRDWTVLVKAGAPVALSLPDSDQPIVLAGGQEHELSAGATVSLGDRAMRFHSNVLEL